MFEILTTTATVNRIPFELKQHIDFYSVNALEYWPVKLFEIKWHYWSIEMGHVFKFNNRNRNKETGTRVWRSDTPFNKDSLPLEPLLTLEPGATEFTDPDAPYGSRYWYLLEVYKGGQSEFNGPYEAYATGTNLGPGSTDLVAGTPGAGFYGEIPSTQLITGTTLASQVGVTEGTAITDAGWLKFSLDGRVLYVSKKPLRHSISWDHLQSKGVVTGTKTITIGGEVYKVRLLSGANTNPSTAANGSFDHPGTHGCEWNRLMYRVSAKPFGNSNNILASEGITEGDWASYSEADLVTHSSGGNGSYSWCQETGTTGATRVCRGNYGVSHLNQYTSSSSAADFGWRACLELVQN